MKPTFVTLAGVLLLAVAQPAAATFSIIACDTTGQCGAAVATNNLAVGATVIHAKARVGAVASQFETNPSHGPKGLALLAGGASASRTVDELVESDDGFEGQDASYRQIGVVAATGNGAAYTGRQAAGSPWAGSLTGPGYSVQGNGLVSADVLNAMRARFLATQGPLASRLMAALEAGEAAGGQSTGRLSTALLVRTPDGGFQDIDLRVDAAEAPVTALRRLLALHQANAVMARAERAAKAGDAALARALDAEAIRLGVGWDRIWRRSSRLGMAIGDEPQALQALAAFAGLNQAWALREIADPIYDRLWRDPRASAWRAGLVAQTAAQ